MASRRATRRWRGSGRCALAPDRPVTLGVLSPGSPSSAEHLQVLDGFTPEEKRALLLFATGCDRAPIGGLEKLKFILQRSGPDSMALPTAHTCFNLLAMPAYASRGKLRDRLTIAIHNAQGFGLQ